jgi:hypothetical protein
MWQHASVSLDFFTENTHLSLKIERPLDLTSHETLCLLSSIDCLKDRQVFFEFHNLRAQTRLDY